MASGSGWHNKDTNEDDPSEEERQALIILSYLPLSQEQLEQLRRDAHNNPIRMLHLAYAQEDSDKKTSCHIPLPEKKRRKSDRVVINTLAAEAKAAAEAEAEAEAAAVAVAEAQELPEVPEDSEEEEEPKVGNRNMLPSSSDEEENAVSEEELPLVHEDNDEEEESQAENSNSNMLPQGSDEDDNAVQAEELALIAALQGGVAALQAIIAALQARPGRLGGGKGAGPSS